MFKVSVNWINGQRHIRQWVATFYEPQTVKFANGEVRVTRVILEPNGSVFLEGVRNGKRTSQKHRFDQPMAPRNNNVDYAVRYLQQEAEKASTEEVSGGQIEFGRGPLDPKVVGFAYSA